MTTENPDLGKPHYESFMRGEYHRDWSNLPAGLKARWNEVATINKGVTLTISADNATITKAIEKLQADIAVVFQQHRAALAEISRALALAGNRLQRLSLEFVMGSSQAIEIREWAEEARAAIENAPHSREDSHPAPEAHALGSCDHRPHPPAPQNSDQQPDRHDHSKSTTTNWACDLAFGEQSEFRHQVAGNETDSKSDPEREKQHLVKVAQDGNEVRDEIDRRESVGSHAACDQLGSERGPLVLSGDPECDCIPLQGFRPAFQSLEPALHTSTYTVTAEETVKPTRAASPAPQTREQGQ